MEMKLVLDLLGSSYPVKVKSAGKGYIVELGGEIHKVDLRQARAGGGLSLLIGNRSVDGWADQGPEGYRITVLGESLLVGAEDILRAGIRKLRGSGAGEELIRSPMPGVVVEVKAPEGALVEAGEPVIIVEAMKMFNEFGPRRGGRVARVMVAAGESVEKDQELALIVPVEDEGR